MNTIHSEQSDLQPVNRDTLPGPALKRSAPSPGFTTAAVVMLLITIIANWRKIDSSDLLFHLKAGQVIHNNGQVPNRDIFSAASAAGPWAYIEWLWAQILAYVDMSASWTGLSILSPALAAITAVLLYVRSKRFNAKPFESLVTVIILLMVLLPVCQATPAIAVVPIFLFSLIAAESQRLRLMALIPIAVALWANIHPAFLLPLLAPASRLILGPSSAVKKEHITRRDPQAYLFVIVAAGLLAALVNPHSVVIYSAMYGRFMASVATFLNDPFHQFTNVSYLWQFGTSIGFIALAVLGRESLVRWQILVGVILAIFCATVTPSGLPLLLVFLAAPASVGLCSIMQNFWTVSPVRHLAAAAMLLFCIMLLPVILLTAGITGKAWGAGIRTDVFPEMPAGRLAAIPLRGSILNQTQHGGYLVWRLWPGWRVTSDDRTELYGTNFHDQYENIWQGATGWQAMFALWRVYAVLGSNETARDFPDKNLFYELAASPDWHAVFWDKHTIVYIKSNINLAATNLEPFRKLKPGLSWQATKAAMNTRKDWADLAADLRRALLDDPTNALASEYLKLAELEVNQ